eukprot:5471379-Prymnesium_polylepis.1
MVLQRYALAHRGPKVPLCGVQWSPVVLWTIGIGVCKSRPRRRPACTLHAHVHALHRATRVVASHESMTARPRAARKHRRRGQRPVHSGAALRPALAPGRRLHDAARLQSPLCARAPRRGAHEPQ